MNWLIENRHWFEALGAAMIATVAVIDLVLKLRETS